MTGSSSQVYFELFTDSEVAPSTQYWSGYSIDPGNLKSGNDIITLIKPVSYNVERGNGEVRPVSPERTVQTSWYRPVTTG